jgi:hypothetical protein
MTNLPHKPDALEGALLLLLLVQRREAETGKGVTRFRVSESTMCRLFNRRRIPLEYLHDVEEWLLSAGWALFYAGSAYAMIRTDAVDGWVRLASSRIGDEINQVARGEYDFAKISPLLQPEAAVKDSRVSSDEIGDDR